MAMFSNNNNVAPVARALPAAASTAPAKGGTVVSATGAPMTEEEMRAEIARLAARNRELETHGQRRLTAKVGEKGALSISGMGRFPVTLYKSQWERLRDEVFATGLINEYLALPGLKLKGE